MIHSLSLAAALAATCVSPFSNAQTTVTSPKSYDTKEGNQTFTHWSGTRRLQAVDNTHKGSIFVVKSLAFRRKASGGGANATARTFDASVLMGLAEWAYQSDVLDDNILPGTASTVFTKKNVSFPDWTMPIAPAPAPFDFKLVYDTPFPYLGQKAFVWSVTYDNNTSQTGLCTTDRQYVAAGPATLNGSGVGPGCITTGQTAQFAHSFTAANFGPTGGMALVASTLRAPANAPVVLMIDGVQSNLNVPGLCGVVYAYPTLQLGIGTSDALGSTANKIVTLPYNAALEAGVLYTQALSVDYGQAGLPVVVSNGKIVGIPNAPAAGILASYQVVLLPGNSGMPNYGGSVIAQLGL